MYCIFFELDVDQLNPLQNRIHLSDVLCKHVNAVHISATERVPHIGPFHFLCVQGDGRKIPGLVKSMNFQRSTAKSPKIPWGWQHFATKFIEIEIFTLTDFSRQSCRCKQEFQGKKGKNIFHWARLENCTSTKSSRHSRTLVVHPLIFSGGFSKGKTCQGSFSRHCYSDDRKFHPIF